MTDDTTVPAGAASIELANLTVKGIQEGLRSGALPQRRSPWHHLRKSRQRTQNTTRSFFTTTTLRWKPRVT